MGCGSSGGNTFFKPVPDGGDLGGGGVVDLAGLPPGDLATVPPDLTTLPDFTTPVDFTTPPDLTIVGGACAPGRYSGPLTVAAMGMALSGTVALTLGPGVNGIYPITMGAMVANAPGITAAAEVTGNLDCGNKRLTGALKNGVAMAFNMMFPFTGVVTADYNSQNRAFVNGMLTIDLFMGTGTWTAAYLGP